MHKKATTLNDQKLQRAITPTTFHLISSKFNQVSFQNISIHSSKLMLCYAHESNKIK